MDEYEKVFTINELLPERVLLRISKAIGKLDLGSYQLTDLNHEVLISSGNVENKLALPLCPELEPIGYFICESKCSNLAHAVEAFILEILQTSWRYKMASSIHIQVSREDFEELSRKNAQLVKSEAKYKALSQNLEKKVIAQVKLIEESQRQLYETEKMASIGQLASGIAHEINNPMGFISSNLGTATDYLGEIESMLTPLKQQGLLQKLVKEFDENEFEFLFSDFYELLRESLDGAKRVTTIVADLKEFSNVDHSEDVLADLSDCAEKVVRILLTSVHRKVSITTDIHPVEKTFCKLGHINQLLLNLLHNAVEAITDNGEIILCCKMRNNMICLEVIDTGIGMCEKTLKRAFEPFYTTHEVGSGTGLGLTVSRDVVLAHKGEISIDSKLGKGTKIRILLPVMTEPAA